MPSAVRLAEWVVRYRADNGAPIDPVSLQKMLFYAHAFRLARHGDSLFSEQIKAWRHGPVVPQVWHHFGAGATRVIFPNDGAPQPQIEEDIELELKNAVDFFSRYNTFVISDATHKEDPWRETWNERDEPSATIPVRKIRAYYAELLADGEESLSRHGLLNAVPEPRLGCYYQVGICVRKMIQHPLYRMDWADAFSGPAAEDDPLPHHVFAPITKREFIPASDL